MSADRPAPVYLVKGSDEVLLGQGVGDLVRDLVGDGDRTLMVEEIDLAVHDADADADAAAAVDAAQTPPFLTDRRVVVTRHTAVLSTKEAVAPLVQYLADPLPSTALVLVWEKDPRPGTKLAGVPKSLGDAVKAAGGQVLDTTVKDFGKERATWVDEQVRHAAVHLDASAKRLLEQQVGGDLGRLRSVLASLEATYGPGAKLTAPDIAPYLGDAGELPSWELTDAIDAGDIPRAIDRLQRMLTAGRHPLQIMATLHGHFERMLRLDGAGVGDERAAAELLGTKATFPAAKALRQGRSLGTERLHECIGLLAQADLDLRGAKAWPDHLVVEVLVARLAGRSRQAGGSRRRAGAR